MNILFYYPDKERSVSLSSLMIAFKQQGHSVFLLTHAQEGDLHADVKKGGVQTFTHTIRKNSSALFYLKHIFYLASFTRKHKIDLVYSHIQLANLISVFAQFLSPSRFILCRHHSDCAYIDNNKNEKAADKIINTLGREFIVPSDKVLNQMTEVEGVKSKKIHLIRYAYDFSGYPLPDKQKVEEIRNTYKAGLLLVKVARLISEKRHIILLGVINKLVLKGMDVKLILLSDGPERDNISKYIEENRLQNNIFMVGYRKDVMNYISAADLIVHVSESEASSSLAKEVGLLKQPLVVCNDVGDFDEYLFDKENCLKLDKKDPAPELEKIIIDAYENKGMLSGLGQNLYKTVTDRFSIENILPQYSQFHTASKK